MKLSSKDEFCIGGENVNKDLLKGTIRSCGMTQEVLAAKIGISLSRFNAKINETNGAEFSLGEVKSMKRVLRLTPDQFDSIFLQ